jgi:CheY-like chemotaxis protein
MPKKILLADDSITIQKVVELTFSDGDYEVTAVNNGAKAIQKLAEMRPDIILSDIIMPDKNGYEVCEYVKSHPEFRTIPVVLLTGTFEPFDPDRAEKAGCDAVVTKPFESQSLIHKVEELIAHALSGSSAPAATPPPPPADAGSPWMDDTDRPRSNSAFSTASGGFPAAPAPESFTHEPDIFAAAPPIEATTEMPFEIPTPSFNDTPSFGASSFGSADTPFDEPASPEFAGETRAFPRMTFEEMQQMAATPAAPEPPPAPEPSPWDEPAALGGETRAFTKMSFEDFQASAPMPQSNETRAIPRVSLEELQRLAAADEAAAAQPAPEPPAAESPWDEPAALGGETRAFTKMSFDDFQAPASEAPPIESSWEPPAFAPEPAAPAFGNDAASPFGGDADAPAFGGETRAFPKLSFEDFQQMSATPAPEPEPEAASPFAAEEPAASPFAAEPSAFEEELPATAIWSAPEAGAEPAEEPPLGLSEQAMPEEMPFASEEAPEEEPAWMTAASQPAPEPEPEEAPVAAASAPAETAPPMPIAARGESSDLPANLTDEQVDRIARRVVELLSDQVVRNIAWEVIPDLAEMVVKERIRQLEAEA